jgi:hypothetical protein
LLEIALALQLEMAISIVSQLRFLPAPVSGLILGGRVTFSTKLLLPVHYIVDDLFSLQRILSEFLSSLLNGSQNFVDVAINLIKLSLSFVLGGSSGLLASIVAE